MNKTGLFVIGGIVLIALGAGLGYVLFEKSPPASNNTTNNPSSAEATDGRLQPTTSPTVEKPLGELMPPVDVTPPETSNLVPLVPTYEQPVITNNTKGQTVQFPNATFVVEKPAENNYTIYFLDGQTSRIIDSIFRDDPQNAFPTPTIKATTNHEIYTWTASGRSQGGDEVKQTFFSVTQKQLLTMNLMKNFALGVNSMYFAVNGQLGQTVSVGIANPCTKDTLSTTITSLILNSQTVLSLPATSPITCTWDDVLGKAVPQTNADWLELKGVSADFTKVYVAFREMQSSRQPFTVTVDLTNRTMTAGLLPADMVR